METDDNGFFIMDIEGFLGDEEKADILFVLREPNDKQPNKFWFKEILSGDYKYANNDKGKEKRAATKYKHILGSFAKSFGTDLKNCAYINLNPKSGGNERSPKYYTMLKAINLKAISKEDEKVKKECKNRIGIIKKIKPKYVITTFDIFYELAKYFGKEEKMVRFSKYNGREIKSFEYNGTNFIGFYHPCYSIKREYLFSMLNEAEFGKKLDINEYPEV